MLRDWFDVLHSGQCVNYIFAVVLAVPNWKSAVGQFIIWPFLSSIFAMYVFLKLMNEFVENSKVEKGVNGNNSLQ